MGSNFEQSKRYGMNKTTFETHYHTFFKVSSFLQDYFSDRRNPFYDMTCNKSYFYVDSSFYDHKARIKEEKYCILLHFVATACLNKNICLN